VQSHAAGAEVEGVTCPQPGELVAGEMVQGQPLAQPGPRILVAAVVEVIYNPVPLVVPVS